MLGRLLFAVVWLIVAAGLLLPLLPSDEAGPAVAVAGGIEQAGAMASDCRHCAPADADGDGCGTFCPCHHLLPAATAAPGLCPTLTVHLLVQPQPAGRLHEPRPLPPKLPAI
jgi:hypothetical protein